MINTRTEWEQRARNDQRSADGNRMRRLLESRITLTEKRFIEDMDKDMSSEIVDHYLLFEGEKEILAAYESNTAPIVKDEHEKTLEWVYHLCKMMERGWHGNTAPTPDTFVGEILELTTKIVKDYAGDLRGQMHCLRKLSALTAYAATMLVVE